MNELCTHVQTYSLPTILFLLDSLDESGEKIKLLGENGF